MLVLAVLLALGLRVHLFEHYGLIAHRAGPLLDGIRRVLRTSLWFQFVLFWWMALRWLPLLPRLQRLRQGPLRLAAGLRLVNLLPGSLAIHRLKLASYNLLFESLLLYGAITLLFLFWYGLIDHPPRDPGNLLENSRSTRNQGVSMTCGIVVPEETLEQDLLRTGTRAPGFSEDLDLTILSSDGFGAPEGHPLVGAPLQRLPMQHSVVMVAMTMEKRT